jgi:putative phage-type endonuclease
MTVKSIIPESKEDWLRMRALNINSTETAALFGLSPYMTEYELFHLKSGQALNDFEGNERTKWGSRLEPAIAYGIAEDQGWDIRPMKEYMFDPVRRMGSSFDFAIGDDGILEIKNVDGLQFKNGWSVDGEDVEAPPGIEIQVQHQLALSKKKFTYLGAFIGGNNVVLIRREPDPAIIAAIFDKIAQFWARVDAKQEPEPDFKRDAEFIQRLHSYAEPGKFYTGDRVAEIETMVHEYSRLGKEAKQIEEQRAALKARILMEIKDAEKVRGEGFSVSAGMVGPARIEYDRKPFRDFRCFVKKQAD